VEDHRVNPKVPDFRYGPGTLLLQDDIWADGSYDPLWLVIGTCWCQKLSGGFWEYVLLGGGRLRRASCWEVNNSKEWSIVTPV